MEQRLRVVIKIGSSSLVRTEEEKASSGELTIKETFLNLRRICDVIETACSLRRLGHDVVLVSSGAVGTGCHVLGLSERPKDLTLAQRQALASVGQVRLMAKYESLFSTLKQACSQVLLTYESFNSKTQFLNASNTFRELFRMGVIPIVNENDTIATKEMQSDNDTLAAMVSSLVGADALFLLTDVDGLYTANPFKDPSAKLIPYVEDFEKLESLCTTTDGMSSWGTGGMSTKITAAGLATSMGVETTVMNATRVEQVLDYVNEASANANKRGKVPVGTTFARSHNPPKQHKRWVRGLRTRGKITVDEGAATALLNRYSLYAVGICKVEGNFDFLGAVLVLNKQGVEIATGISNYSSDDVKRMIGKSSTEIYEMGLGNSDNAVISRRNIALHNTVQE